MMDYMSLWAKASEVFSSWEEKQYPNGSVLTDADRILFVTGWIQGYLFLNQVEVCNG